MKKQYLLHSICAVVAIAAAAALSMNAQAGTCYVNVGQNIQTIDGFGFSTAWCGQPSGAINNLMGTGGGQCGFSLLRIRIDPNKAWTDETANASRAHGKPPRFQDRAWGP